MKHALLLSTLVATVAFAAPPTSKPAHVALLDHFAGEWTAEAAIKIGNQTDPPQTTKGTVNFHWTLNHTFLQADAKWSSGAQDLYLYGYDTLKNEYRLWHFGSNGQFVEYKGIWEEKNHSFTWASAPRNGVTAITKYKFEDDGSLSFGTTARNKDGETLLEIQGLLKRKK